MRQDSESLPRPPLALGRPGLLAIGSILIGGLSGCPKPNSNQPPVYPVSGAVFVRGQPAALAIVRLYPVGEVSRDQLCPHAVVRADGSFSLTTFQTEDGAPCGSYAVTITWPAPPKPGRDSNGTDRLLGRYAHRQQPARIVEIRPEANQLEPFNLD